MRVVFNPEDPKPPQLKGKVKKMTRKKKCLECASELTVVIKYVPNHHREMQRAYACFKCGIYDADSIAEEVFQEIGGHIYRDQLL